MATIALDAMGGDFGPEVVIPAAVHVVKKSRDIHIILVGDETRLRDFAKDHDINLDEHFEIYPNNVMMTLNLFKHPH